MYPVSAAFLAAIRQNHRIATRLDICQPDGTVLLTTTQPSDGRPPGISVSAGQVTVDATRQVRREGSFTIPDFTGLLSPAAAGDPLSPLSGNEVRPYRGVTYSDGTTELVPLGVLRIMDAPVDDTDTAVTITLGVQDRSVIVSRNRWTGPYTIAAGTAVEDALSALLTNRYPSCLVQFPVTGRTTPAVTLGVDTDNDPWADAQKIAMDSGYRLYFDVTGTAVLQQPSDPTTATPVITYANDSTSVLTEAHKSWDVDKGYNGAQVIGEGSGVGAPVQAIAWDDDPTSPTYYLGPYGAYPEFYSSPLITTTDQALARAQAMVAARRGAAQTVSWSQLANPALEGDDAVLFTHTDLRINTATVVVLDSFTVPFMAADAMPAATRTRQVSA